MRHWVLGRRVSAPIWAALILGLAPGGCSGCDDGGGGGPPGGGGSSGSGTSGGGNGGSAGSPGDPVACAQVVLRPSPGARERRHGLAAADKPSISIDLERTPGAARTVVSLEPCNGAGAPKTIEVKGSNSFVVDDAFVRANVDALTCFRARANVFAEGGEWLGGAGAMTRLGDGVIEGSVEAPPGGMPGGEGLRGTRVSLAIEGMVLNAELVGSDKFRFDHVPSGRVLALRAEKRAGGVSYRGEAFPAAAAVSGSETLSLKVALAAAEEPLDSFEPDPSIKAVSGRTPLEPGAEQSRSLSSPRDVDVVPVAAHAGRALWARVRPKGGRADVALTLTDGAGVRLAGANDGGSAYQREPIASYAPAADGVIYLRVRRNDDEPGQVDYVLSVFEEGAKP
jgi:hypothetical protein